MDELQNNQVDKLFRDNLRFHKDKPADDLWTSIENSLDKEDNLIYKTRTRRHILIAAGLLVLMTGFGVYTYINIHTNKALAGQTKQKDRSLSDSQVKNQQLNQASPVNNFVLNITTGKQNNSSLTKKESLYFHKSSNPDLNLVSDTADYFLHFAPIQTPESKVSLIQTDRNNFSPRQLASAKMIVKTEKRSFLNKLSITALFSQEFAGYNLSDDDATAADGREIEKRERNAFSASMGLYLKYRINRRWVIQSGLSYSWSTSNIDSSKSFAVKDNSGSVQFKMNTISGYGYLQCPPTLLPNVGDSVLTDKAYSRIHYLTLPLIFSYRIPMNRFSLLLGAGVSFNLLTSATLETKIYRPNLREEESVIPIKGLKNLNYGVILKADLEYHINSRLSVNLIPSFKNSLSPINIHSALAAYPYNFGLGAGITYQF